MQDVAWPSWRCALALLCACIAWTASGTEANAYIEAVAAAGLTTGQQSHTGTGSAALLKRTRTNELPANTALNRPDLLRDTSSNNSISMMHVRLLQASQAPDASHNTDGDGSGSSSSPDNLDLLDQFKLEDGSHATKKYVKSLADRHFAFHGVKWPSQAFIRAVKDATMVVPMHEDYDGMAAAGAAAGTGDTPGAAANRPGGSGGAGGDEAASSKVVRRAAVHRARELPRLVVLMAMTNDVALEHTVPTFVQSLRDTAVRGGAVSEQKAEAKAAEARRLQQRQQQLQGQEWELTSEGSQEQPPFNRQLQSGGGGSGALPSGSLSDHLVLACSSDSAVLKCQGLGLGSRCVLDEDMALGNKSLPFHSLGFNMIGFAKVKYIVNTLSLGRDVIFMDTDIVVFRNFVPYILTMGADMAATVEKCKVVDDHADYAGRPIKGFPMFNIGVTYFNSAPAVLRCAYNWLYDMWMEVQDRPRLWDQDVFRKVMFHCTKALGVRLHAFSPRLFNSHCYKPCGCDYGEEAIHTKVDKHLRPVGYSNAGNGTCPKRVVSQWLLMHFPCSGETSRKADLMQWFSKMHQESLDQG